MLDRNTPCLRTNAAGLTTKELRTTIAKWRALLIRKPTSTLAPRVIAVCRATQAIRAFHKDYNKMEARGA